MSSPHVLNHARLTQDPFCSKGNGHEAERGESALDDAFQFIIMVPSELLVMSVFLVMLHLLGVAVIRCGVSVHERLRQTWNCLSIHHVVLDQDISDDLWSSEKELVFQDSKINKDMRLLRLLILLG